jgi:hypothetical protein
MWAPLQEGVKNKLEKGGLLQKRRQTRLGVVVN